jgi:hypothetical protein
MKLETCKIASEIALYEAKQSFTLKSTSNNSDVEIKQGRQYYCLGVTGEDKSGNEQYKVIVLINSDIDSTIRECCIINKQYGYVFFEEVSTRNSNIITIDLAHNMIKKQCQLNHWK